MAGEVTPENQVFFGSGKPEINAPEAGEAIASLWRDFTHTGPGINYGQVLSRILDWAKTYDEKTQVLPSRRQITPELAKQSQQLSKFAVEYKTILSEINGSLKLEMNTPARSLEEKSRKREMAGIKAVFNQRLAAEFQALADEPPESTRRKNAKIFLDIAESLSKMSGPAARLGTEIKTAIAGAKAQVAVMRLLREKGFTTIAPDWKNPKEVYDMDVHAKVDFAAFNARRLLFVDAKSRSMIHFEGEKMVNHMGFVKGTDRVFIYLRQARFASDLKEKVGDLPQTHFEHFEIYLPTFSEYVGDFGDKLDPQISHGILSGLNLKE